MLSTRVQIADFDPAREAEALAGPDVGAMASFVGFCRNELGSLSGLELEHYPGMAEAQLHAVVDLAARRWGLLGAVVVHRTGWIAAGERIVFVATTASHRGPAFSAAEFIMDYLKSKAPFWKRERRIDGSFGAWVAPKENDDAAFERWSIG